MTRDFNQFISCPYCDASFPAETAFCRWMRKERALDSAEGVVRTDLDHIIHRYQRNKVGREFQTLMVVEVKERLAKPSASQRDTLLHFGQYILNRTRNMHLPKHELRQFVAGAGVCKLYSTIAKKEILSRFYGVHLLQFSATNPDDSEKILWDGKQINPGTLIELLRMDLDPTDLQKMDLRDHHRKNREPMLFELQAA